MPWPRLRNLLLALTSVVCLGFAVFVAYSLIARPGFREVPIGGPFALIDQAGRNVTERDFQGRYALLYFGYTSCPDVCPTKLIEMTDGLTNFEERWPDRGLEVVPLFFTVDPARDTREALEAYMPHFHERFVALTGTEAEIASVVKAYRASYRKVPSEDGGPYLMDHTSYVYLMGPEGRYLTHFTAKADAKQIADGLDRYVR